MQNASSGDEQPGGSAHEEVVGLAGSVTQAQQSSNGAAHVRGTVAQKRKRMRQRRYHHWGLKCLLMSGQHCRLQGSQCDYARVGALTTNVSMRSKRNRSEGEESHGSIGTPGSFAALSRGHH